MKKFLVSLIGAASFTATVASCDKQEGVEVAPTQEKESTSMIDKDKIANPFDYARENLTIMGKGVMISANKSPRFKNLLYSEIDRKFDGDYNVLIDKLESSGRQVNISLKENIQESIGNNMRTTNFADNLLKAFADINGYSYNAQVFIPFYEELKTKGVIGKKPPVMVAFDGDEKNTTVDGFVLNEKNVFVKLPHKVDESFARENEVWVFSINERTGGCIECNKNTPQKSSRIASTRMAKIKKLNIKTHKESWMSGANDIYMRHMYTTETGLNWRSDRILLFGGCKGETVAGYNQVCYIGDWPQNSLNILYNWPVSIREVYLNINYGTDSFGSGAQDNILTQCLVIFEHDNWPTAENIHYFTVGSEQYGIAYRSAESSYIGVVLDARNGSLPNVHTYNGSNGDIALEIRVE